MKIFLSCVGRRVELVQAFRSAAKRLNINLEIYGMDFNETAPAIHFCDHAVYGMNIRSDEYINQLREFCLKENIDAVIPTIDTDLLVLALNKESFGNTKVIVSNPDKVKLCRDKRLTSDYLNSLGLYSPKATDNINDYNQGLPAFIKPKDGSSSINAFKVNNKEELEEYAKHVPDYIVQPFIKGVEYTVDIFCDFNGSPVYITPRIRLATRSGEVLKTKIVQDKKIKEECLKLINEFKPVGQITVQLIRDESTGIDYFIEINPRFGGGAPLSIKAGADSTDALLRLLNGEKLNYVDNAAEDGAMYSRYDQSIKIN